ncbi:phenol hydroxylase [Paraburkholderia sp. CNPSo 3157]|uniref:Phenol hydroxylase n=1 Tax=Paraburkholderia franconis TaxID=2654983 RepID=A0A7X1TKZ7_9BURK|nr:phenol hydroxylase subunit P4 [Paraburkholderia franconis]MPW22934.1 phenol hydroxylase [Paraburkholderia franconis]
MATIALKPYAFEPADAETRFHGKRLLYIGWEDHLMFASPFCIPVSPDMTFGALVSDVLPGLYGVHPDFAKIDWDDAQWLRSGQPWQPDSALSIADNGLVHKDVIRLRTPGLTGINGSYS